MRFVSLLPALSFLAVAAAPTAAAGPASLPDCREEIHNAGIIVSCVGDGYELVLMFGNYGHYDCRGDPGDLVIAVQSGNHNNLTCH